MDQEDTWEGLFSEDEQLQIAEECIHKIIALCGLTHTDKPCFELDGIKFRDQVELILDEYLKKVEGA